MVSETRYMRSDQHTVNGLMAYKLGIAQSAFEVKVATLAAASAIESTLRPNEDFSVTFPVIHPLAPPTHYDKVDEAIPNDGTDYIRTDDTHLTYYNDIYNKPPFALPGGKKIAGVLITARIKTEYFPTTLRQARAYIGVYIGGVFYLSGLLRTNGAWQTVSYWFEKDPSTGLAWTQAGVNNARIAVRGATYKYLDDYNYMWCSTIWMDVYTYTDATIFYSISIWKRDSVGTETPIETNTAWFSSLISALHDSAGLKGPINAIISPAVPMVSTDAIVVRVYQRILLGSWTFVEEFITEQLGAQSLDVATWYVYYYLKIDASTTVVNSEFWFGHIVRNSHIENFTWTPLPPPPPPAAGLHPSKVVPLIING